MKRLGLLIIAGLLTSCGTSPIRLNDAVPVPPDRTYVSPTPSPGDGMVAVIRDTGIEGHGCGEDVFLDGKKVATLGAGEKAIFPATAGDHLVSVATTGKGLCGIGDAKDAGRRDLKTTITAGHQTTFRFGIGPAGDLIFMQTSL